MSFMGKVRVLMLKGEKGDQGEAGTSGDYAELSNKPTINGVTLTGAMTSGDLGLESAGGVEVIVEQMQAQINELIHTALVQITIPSLPTNQSVSASQDVSLDGYKAVGVVGFYLSSGNKAVIIHELQIYDYAPNMLDYRLSNVSEDSFTNLRLNCTVLYVKLSDDSE